MLTLFEVALSADEDYDTINSKHNSFNQCIFIMLQIKKILLILEESGFHKGVSRFWTLSFTKKC